MNEETIKNIFSDEFLKFNDMPVPENFDLNNFTFRKIQFSILNNIENRMKARRLVEPWYTKRYPNTVRENKEIFLNYIDLCKEHNIFPIAVLFPVTDEYRALFSKQIIDEFYCIIKELQRKDSFVFFDEYKCNILSHQEFFDGMHLNDEGAKKFSKYLSDKIMKIES